MGGDYVWGLGCGFGLGVVGRKECHVRGGEGAWSFVPAESMTEPQGLQLQGNKV